MRSHVPEGIRQEVGDTLTKIILASQSPRRRDLLSKMIKDFEIVVADVEENSRESLPEKRVMQLAYIKAKAVYDATEGDRAVIGSDTLCYLDGRYLGKPDGVEGAREMLAYMSGKTHEVYTGVAVILNDKAYCFYDCSKVRFKDLSANDIEDYINRSHPLDKAGSYGIQDGAVVAGFEGSFDNIVGLPTEKLKEKLGELGLLEG